MHFPYSLPSTFSDKDRSCIWVGTDSGISRLTPQGDGTTAVRNITLEHGLVGRTKFGFQLFDCRVFSFGIRTLHQELWLTRADWDSESRAKIIPTFQVL